MSTNDDGKNVDNVIDIKSKRRVQYTTDDPVIALANALTSELGKHEATLAERWAALGVVSRALSTLAKGSGLSDDQLDVIKAEAVRLAKRCEVKIR